MRNSESTNSGNGTSLKPQEEFLRQVIFLKDEEKVLAVFPFYHEISNEEYESVIGNFYEEEDMEIPPKSQFCLMNEVEFGWGWIHNKMIAHLDVAETEDYVDFKHMLVSTKVIKESFILNED